MKLIDTHSHLYLTEFDSDRTEIDQRAKRVLSAVYLPNIDQESIAQVHALSDSDPDFYRPLMGLHPCYVKADFESVLAHMKPLFAQRKYYGVGECGLDLYWDKTFFEAQKIALETQITWAKEFNLPIILHCRSALNESLDLIEKHHDSRLKGIFHCFDGDETHAKRIAALGNFKMGIGGVVTYKKSTLPDLLTNIDLSLLVLETDSPYLPPTPFRGKRNESSYITYVAQRLVDIYGMSLVAIAEATSKNAVEIFGN
jgi:TatD DNase family protein